MSVLMCIQNSSFLYMNYKIINDIEELQRFIDWLPDLKDNEIFYGCLFARKKYASSLVSASDKAQLKRFTFKKHNLIEKIKQLEVAVGAYKLKDREAPQESLALYMNPNPRDQKKAAFKTIKHLTDLLEKGNKDYNIHQEVLSVLQQTAGSTYVVDFDVDFKEGDSSFDLILRAKEAVGRKEALTVVITRGGFHALVQPTKVDPNKRNTWYQGMCRIGSVDQKGDQLLPIPGTTQGGFVPYMKTYQSTIND